MTVEQYYQDKTEIGTVFTRISDGRKFKVVDKKLATEFGKRKMLFTLEADNGYRFPHDSHALDCFYNIDV